MKIIKKLLLVTATFFSLHIECAFQLPGNMIFKAPNEIVPSLFDNYTNQLGIKSTKVIYGGSVIAACASFAGYRYITKNNPITTIANKKGFKIPSYSPQEIQVMERSIAQVFYDSNKSILNPFAALVGTRQEFLTTWSTFTTGMQAAGFFLGCFNILERLKIDPDGIIPKLVRTSIGLGACGLTYKMYHNYQKERAGIYSKRIKYQKDLKFYERQSELLVSCNDNIEYVGYSQEDELNNFIKVEERRESSAKAKHILIPGAPGLGKTFIAKYIAQKLDRHVVFITKADIADKYYGESEKNIKRLQDRYEAEKKNAKKEVILWFDEVESLFARRIDSTESENAINNSVVNQCLPVFEDLAKNGVMCGATTNNLNYIDSAMKRRFKKIEINNPKEQDRNDILKYHFKQLFYSRNPSEDVMLKIVEKTKNYNRDQVSKVVEDIEEKLRSQPEVKYKEFLINLQTKNDLDDLLKELGYLNQDSTEFDLQGKLGQD